MDEPVRLSTIGEELNRPPQRALPVVSMPVPGGTQHIVLPLHGIRTLGEWQDIFVETVKTYYRERNAPVPFEMLPVDHGVFSTVKFLLPLTPSR